MKNEKTIELYAQIIREIKVRLSCRGLPSGATGASAGTHGRRGLLSANPYDL